MKRRSFIRLGGMAGSVFAVHGLTNCNKNTGEKLKDWNDFALNEITISDLKTKYNLGELDIPGVVDMYLSRINEIDKQGPAINSIITLNPSVHDEAEKLQKEGESGRPLWGVPLLIKDNIDVAGEMPNTAGSLALKENFPIKDGFIIQKLREAGAIILGKANLSEWANFRSTRSSSGWSAMGGQTKNPYVLQRNPCGSSSGPGAAISANFCTIAIGTETNGSIVCPSSANGIVGIKPTVGLWSRSGIIPVSHTQDTAGPMARTVKDAAILLGALAGRDPEDLSTLSAPDENNLEYTRFLNRDGLRNARIGVAREFFGFHEKVDALIEEAIALMRSEGAEIMDPVEIAVGSKAEDAAFDVLLYEFRFGINKYLGNLSPGIPHRTLDNLIAFNKENEETEMPYFQQEIFLMAAKKGGFTDRVYLQALQKLARVYRKEGIDKICDKLKLDAIVAPTGGPAWTTDLLNGDHFLGGSSSPAARAGYPNITVPAGHVHGLPVGISFFGKAWSEPVLLKIAYAYEQASQNRKVPEFLNTI
ncbi:MAG: amidase [Bacteroidota bacterium]